MVQGTNIPEIEWDTELYTRYGADTNLCGIRVFYDFDWTDVLGHDRTQFRRGKSLAAFARQSCPTSCRAALLLTRRTDVDEGGRVNGSYWVLVVNIDRYLREAAGEPAATYFARRIPQDVLSTAINWTSLPNADLLILLNRRLDPDMLRAWVGTDQGRFRMLLQVLAECDIDPHELTPGGGAGVAERMNERFWTAIGQLGVDLPEALAHRRLWSVRNSKVQDFRTHLREGDWNEAEWQGFFENNIWIFGYGLSYQFLHLIGDQPDLGGADFTGRGSQQGDYLMATQAETGFTVLVEIKRPDMELVRPEARYRNRTYELGRDLTGGVAQLQQQCWRWSVVASRLDENRDPLERQGIFTHEPKGILVPTCIIDYTYV